MENPTQDSNTNGDVIINEDSNVNKDFTNNKNPKQRLIITKMRLENFKSYAGTRDIGPFHKCFSAIVGPNGSGKSNVIDALMFVFGKRAKKLRLNKVSELIHRSSEHPDCTSASVSVYFQEIIDTGDGDEDYEVVPDTEIVLSRVATMNNQSKYMMNQRTCTFAQVNKILKARGVDLEQNRFLILQGEVESIAMMKPKGQTVHEDGLLEYLEDIIGSNKYVEPTLELEKEVEGLNEVRTEKLNRLRVAEKEKENLDGPRAEAEAYLVKEEALSKKTNILYQKSVAEAASMAEECRATCDGIEDELKSKQESLCTMLAGLKVQEREYNKMSEDQSSLEEELERSKTEYSAFERRDIKIREDMKHAKTQIKKLECTLNRESTRQNDLKTSCEEFEQALPGLEKDVAKLSLSVEKETDVLDSMMKELSGETEDLRVQLEAKQAEIAPKHAKMNEAKSVLDASNTEMQLIKDASDKVKAQRVTAQESLDEATKTEEENKRLVKELKAETESNATRLEEANEELASAKNDEKSFSKQLRTVRQKLDDARGALQNFSTTGKMMQKLMKASKPGCELERAGLLGRLGDLGAIDKKYDVAISTACGSLGNLVVETTEGAQACVQYLRKNNLGRATFIILEKLSYLDKRIDADFRQPKRDTPRLFDLVNIREEKLKRAFYFALRDTLVADNIDVASSVAYQGKKCLYRVVTLDGKMIEMSGAMSGGGKTVRKGGMSSELQAPVVSSAEMAELESTVKELSYKVSDAQESQKSLQLEVRTLTKSLKASKGQIPKLEIEIKSFKSLKVELTKQLSDLKGKDKLSKDEEKKLKALQKTIDEKTKVLDKISNTVATLEAELEDLQQQILDVGGEPLRKQKEKVESTSDKLEKLNAKIAKGSVDAKSTAKNIEKSIKAENKAKDELDVLKTELEATKASFKKIEEDAFMFHGQVEKAKEAMAQQESLLKKKKKEYDGLKKKVEAIKSLDIDLQNKLEDENRLYKENKSKVDIWNKKIEMLHESYHQLKEEFGCFERRPRDASEMETEEKSDDDDLSTLSMLSPEKLEEYSVKNLKYDIAMLTEERDTLKANVNMSCLAEYKAKEAEYNERVSELEAATESRDEKRREYESLRRKRLDEFMAGFRTITLKLKEMYQMITLGGDAELELVDSLDPFSEGVVFSVRPSKKSWKNISNLSGGEKTLASLALVFALHHYMPTPLYVMDEIDAALDFKNVSIVGNYIKDRTKNAQFIIISLRNNMFELADRLVGIYKTNNATKSVTINPKHYLKKVSNNDTIPPSSVALQDRTNNEA